MRSTRSSDLNARAHSLAYRAVWCVLLLVVLLMLPARAIAQQFVAVNEKTAFHTDSSLVLVPVTVTDRNGAIVNGLPRDAFSVKENGVEQEIRAFSVDEEPVSIGIVFDLSGSMKDSLGGAKEALGALTASANPDDEAFLETVSTHPQSVLGFTNDVSALLNEVAFDKARGDTALVDSVWQSLDHIRAAAHQRKALIVISDGMDNHSRHSQSELLERSMEADLQIYTISIFNPPANRKSSQLMEEQHGLLLMEELAQRTGGLQFMVRSNEDMQQAAASIGAALRNRYNIGYIPANGDRSGQWRKIQVKVARSGLKAHARTGYRLD
ncbi:MAG: VWA domain-containing protein [Bryobacteraceae bacterium]